jgi:hypothetical protein
MQSEGSIEIRDVVFHGLRKKEYVARAKEERGVLNEFEMDLLDEVIKFVCDKNSARTISEFSHKLPWEMAEFGEVIPYETALLLFPVEASPEAFEAVEQGAGELEAERSQGGPVGVTELSAFRSRVLSQIGAR